MLELAGAAYMVIHNNTDADDALVGASSPAAEFVELHLSSMDDEGMMSMNQVAEIAIPAHGDAVLKPGSYHVMLIDLVEPLTEGAEVRARPRVHDGRAADGQRARAGRHAHDVLTWSMT